jgi:acyl-CoA synthetase (NDP forming)
MEFWTEPQMASIHKMLNPRSIAIVGATPRMQYGGRFLAAALKAKNRVRVYAVNPRYDEIMGVKSYPSVADLPEAPDVVGIVVPHDQVLDVLKESHRKGTGSAIVISAGFAERGVDDRRDLQGEVGAFARASGMRISGPNCLGLANVKVGLRIDQRVPRGTVPRGEAQNVHRGSGRYISIIGNNDLFHNTNDRGPEAVDLKAIERFANAFAMITTSLARA